MSDAVSFQHVSIECPKHSRIPNLNGIGEVLWQLSEERIELAHKVLCTHPVALKFKQERPGVRAEVCLSVGREHQILEQARIEETGVWLAGFGPIARVMEKVGIVSSSQTLKHISKS